MHTLPSYIFKIYFGIIHSQCLVLWNNLFQQKVQLWKLFFPKITDRLKLKINVTPNFTTMVTGHGNIKSYLFKYKIKDSPTCSSKSGEQTVDHIIFDCELVEKERDLKPQYYGRKTGQWTKIHLSTNIEKNLKIYEESIVL